MKSLKLKTGLIAMLFCFGIAAVSNAQSREERKPKNPPTFSELLEDMDSGKDGKLSISEAIGPLKEIFGEIDANEDGFITEEEFNNAPKPKGRKPKSKN